ncbi:MAG TPA: NADP-dependent oxidoreductase [Acidobacteriaceae bacterium]|nr:NADP-dependent oxidoreductase [Acidobacteriaceae bacterium]
MKAGRIHRFGPPEVVVIDEIPRPELGDGELVVQTAFAGVAPWDALIRERKSVVNVKLPLILGSDLSGIVVSVGNGVTNYKPGDAIYGVTNKDFCGAYAEYALVSASMVAPKPRSLSFAEAASAPVVAVTAWQMLFEYAQLQSGQSVLIHGAAGNVGAYAVQLARRAGLKIFATAGPDDLDHVQRAGTVINYKTDKFEDLVPSVDAVMDMIGGETQQRSIAVLKPGGILVSVVSPFPKDTPVPSGIRTAFFLVDVTTARLNMLTQWFEAGELVPAVGAVLPLEEARRANEMLAGLPHPKGKILLRMPNFAEP